MLHRLGTKMGNIAQKAGIWKNRVGEDAEDAVEATGEFARDTAKEATRRNPKEGL